MEKEEKMRHYQQPGEFNPVNVRLSFEKVKDFTNALSPEVLTGDLAKRKKMADKAMEYLDSYFGANLEGIMSFGRCGPRPRLPSM